MASVVALRSWGSVLALFVSFTAKIKFMTDTCQLDQGVLYVHSEPIWINTETQLLRQPSILRGVVASLGEGHDAPRTLLSVQTTVPRTRYRHT